MESHSGKNYSFQTTAKPYIRFFLTILFAVAFLPSCKQGEDAAAELSVSISELAIPGEGITSAVSVMCTEKWHISNSSSSWLSVNPTSGDNGTTMVELTAAANNTSATRTAIVTVTSDSGKARRITCSQPGNIYPSYNTSPQPPDATGMNSTAVELAAKINLGWNIGNTMEAPGGESGWGNPKITEDYVKAVKANGFNAIRIPCAWNWYHVDNQATAHIDQNWLNRVKEVVGYCVNNDMYVLLNIHWDGGWLENNIAKAKQDSVSAKQKALWEQIATTMRDFDEHLMFASANEPAADNAEETGVLLQYHQTFIDAVRSTGGKNSYRVLVLQGPSTSMTLTPDLMSTLPKDSTPNRLMVEVHNYTPAQFCFLNEDASWGKMFYYWGSGHHSTIEPDRNATWGEEDEQTGYFQTMKQKFVDKGIPVLIGEYGAYRRDGSAHVPADLETHEAAVDAWITFATKQAKDNGMVPFWWDTGGALDRTNYTVKDQRTIDAILAGAN